jgi:hypothetical protein
MGVTPSVSLAELRVLPVPSAVAAPDNFWNVDSLKHFKHLQAGQKPSITAFDSPAKVYLHHVCNRIK